MWGKGGGRHEVGSPRQAAPWTPAALAAGPVTHRQVTEQKLLEGPADAGQPGPEGRPLRPEAPGPAPPPTSPFPVTCVHPPHRLTKPGSWALAHRLWGPLGSVCRAGLQEYPISRSLPLLHSPSVYEDAEGQTTQATGRGRSCQAADLSGSLWQLTRTPSSPPVQHVTPSCTTSLLLTTAL